MPYHADSAQLEILQRDNDSENCSKLCKAYLGKKQSAGVLSVMDCPAKSTNLNAIVLLVWKKFPLNQSNVWEVLQETRHDFSTEYLNRLAARMEKSVIMAKF